MKRLNFLVLFKKKRVLPVAGATLLVISGLIIWGLQQPKKAEAPTTDSVTYYYD